MTFALSFASGDACQIRFQRGLLLSAVLLICWAATPLATPPAGAHAASSASETDPTRSLSRGILDDTIAMMIRDLEAPQPDYRKFLKEYGPPDIVSDAEAAGDLDQAAEMFRRRVAKTTLDLLKHIRTQKPVSKTDTEVAYDVKDQPRPDNMEEKMGFTKIRGKWYMN